MDSLGEGRSKNSSASNDVLDMFNPSAHHHTMPDREREKDQIMHYHTSRNSYILNVDKNIY